MNIVFNSTLLKGDQLSLPLNDRAFCYGDGLFETLLCFKGQILHWSDHFKRLQEGMEALSMAFPEEFTEQRLGNQITELFSANQLDGWGRIRIQVWRQAGGFYTPAVSEANYLITVQATTPPTVSVKSKALFYEDTRLFFSPVSRFKTCNALPYVLAGIARQKAAADEMILLDVFGHLSECIASNLFWVRENTVYTPSLRSGCIEGVMRKELIRQLRKAGFTLVEGLYPKKTLLDADCAFCCNVAGIQWLEQVEGHRFPEKRPPELDKWLQSWIAHV
jgi:4-amino-4-deoxychorismate lyase